MERNKLIGARLQAERTAQGLKQEAVAKKLNISRSALSRIENGEISIPLLLAIDYCKLLNISIDHLLFGVDDA